MLQVAAVLITRARTFESGFGHKCLFRKLSRAFFFTILNVFSWAAWRGMWILFDKVWLKMASTVCLHYTSVYTYIVCTIWVCALTYNGLRWEKSVEKPLKNEDLLRLFCAFGMCNISHQLCLDVFVLSGTRWSRDEMRQRSKRQPRHSKVHRASSRQQYSGDYTFHFSVFAQHLTFILGWPYCLVIQMTTVFSVRYA